jgi:hypothetical protein
MPNDSMRTVLVALGSGFAIAVAKAVVAVVTGSSAKALVRGIESGMKRESEAVYRVDIVPIGGASA